MRRKWIIRVAPIGGATLALLLSTAVPADAQRRRAPTRTRTPTPPPARVPAPQVADASPEVVRLSKGGAAKTITITGSHLERLTGGRIERPNGRALNAHVTLPGRRVPPGGLTRRVVRVQAIDRTGTGNNLRLVLTTARDRLGRVTEVAVPVRLVVLDAVRIDRARAASELRAGGEAVRFVIAGQGLWQLHHPRLERNGRTVPGTSVEFVDRAGRRTTLAIRAGSNVAAGPADVVAGTVDRPMRIGRVEVLPPPIARTTLEIRVEGTGRVLGPRLVGLGGVQRIACGGGASECSFTVRVGEPIRLEASPGYRAESGWRLVRWDGCAPERRTGSCTVTPGEATGPTRDRSGPRIQGTATTRITAVFAPVPFVPAGGADPARVEVQGSLIVADRERAFSPLRVELTGENLDRLRRVALVPVPGSESWAPAVSLDQTSPGRALVSITYPGACVPPAEHVLRIGDDQGWGQELGADVFSSRAVEYCGPGPLDAVDPYHAQAAAKYCSNHLAYAPGVPPEIQAASQVYSTLFHDACVTHDNCYRHGACTYGESRSSCDDAFRSAMLEACEVTDLESLLSKEGLMAVFTGGSSVAACKTAADIYYQAVRRVAEGSFHDAESGTYCRYRGR